LVGGFSGTFYAAVAYFNRANGEIGPISAVSGAISASANRLHIYYLKPWTVMPEVANLIDVLIFIGTTSDPTAMQLQAIDPSPAIGVGVTMKEIINTGDEIDFRSLVAYEIPRGSKFVKTVRGFTLFGGAHGPAGENNDRDQVSMLAPSATKELIEAYGPVKSLGSITGPSWWSGLRISNLPGGPNYALLDELEYYDNATGRVRWKTAELITVSSARSLTNIPMQKGFIGVSEQGFPWQASELSIVDLIQGADVEYAARLGDGYVIATQYETYSLFFGRSPSGTQPRLISDQDGAIAPMIEHDMGVATTSTRGPVNIPGLGVPDWIGERVEDLFLDGLMDSTGFMHHGIVGFDRQRQLVYYGYRKDLYNTDFADAPTDDEKSKVGCDFFLVWSPRANAWSTWTVPEHLANILWMGELLFDDGRPRFCFLVGPPAEARIYAFDDDYFDTFDETGLPSLNINADDLDNSLVIGKGYRISCIGSPLVFAKLKVGMEVYVTTIDGSEFRARARFNSLEDTAVAAVKTLYLDGPINQQANDKLHAGVITMSFRQKTYPNQHDWQGRSIIESVQARHSADSASGDLHLRVTLAESEGTDEIVLPTRKLETIRTRIEQGSRIGTEHEVRVEVVGRGNVAIKDVLVEEAPGG
jgi:hypothetical protein